MYCRLLLQLCKKSRSRSCIPLPTVLSRHHHCKVVGYWVEFGVGQPAMQLAKSYT